MKIMTLVTIYAERMTVKRAVKANGVIGDPVVVLSDLRTSRPMAVDPSGITGLRESEIIQTLTEVFHIFVEGLPDIREGDVCVLDDEEYIVRIAQEQKAPGLLAGMDFTRLTVEHLRI